MPRRQTHPDLPQMPSSTSSQSCEISTESGPDGVSTQTRLPPAARAEIAQLLVAMALKLLARPRDQGLKTQKEPPMRSEPVERTRQCTGPRPPGSRSPPRHLA